MTARKKTTTAARKRVSKKKTASRKKAPAFSRGTVRVVEAFKNKVQTSKWGQTAPAEWVLEHGKIVVRLKSTALCDSSYDTPLKIFNSKEEALAFAEFVREVYGDE